METRLEVGGEGGTRHVDAFGDDVCEALSYGSLAHPRFPQQKRVAFLSS